MTREELLAEEWPRGVREQHNPPHGDWMTEIEYRRGNGFGAGSGVCLSGNREIMSGNNEARRAALVTPRRASNPWIGGAC